MNAETTSSGGEPGHGSRRDAKYLVAGVTAIAVAGLAGVGIKRRVAAA